MCVHGGGVRGPQSDVCVCVCVQSVGSGGGVRKDKRKVLEGGRRQQEREDVAVDG